MCPRSSGPFHIVSYHIKWLTTSWTNSIYKGATLVQKGGEEEKVREELGAQGVQSVLAQLTQVAHKINQVHTDRQTESRQVDKQTNK